jgi:hypothetical protein
MLLINQVQFFGEALELAVFAHSLHSCDITQVTGDYSKKDRCATNTAILDKVLTAGA